MTILTPEAIIRRVVSIYEDNYATSLTTVEANWSSTEDITLVDFLNRVITANPEVLPKVWEYPLMQCNIGPIEGVQDANYQQYVDWYEAEIQIYYYLRHSDARTLALLIHRHEEATLDMLKQHPSLDYGENNRVSPGTVSMVPSNVSSSSGILTQGLRVSFRFRFMNYGF